MRSEKLRLLIGGSSSKFFHLNEFVKALEKNKVDCKLVQDVEYCYKGQEFGKKPKR